MFFLVLPKARDAVGLYVKYTMLTSDENVTWKSCDERENKRLKEVIMQMESQPNSYKTKWLKKGICRSP